MAVTYKWDVETSVDEKDGDVLDHYQEDKLSDLMPFLKSSSNEGEVKILVLVRDDNDGRAWAYTKEGVLPEMFSDAYNRHVAKVPKRFHDEIKKAFA